MRRWLLLIPVIAFSLGVFFVGAYLAPDDLRQCDTKPATSGKTCLQADAIVAISGGKTPVRTEEAIRLYKNGWAKYLIFSGAAEDTSGPSNAEVMRHQAINAGVPADAILLDTSARTTHQNAADVHKLLAQHGIKRLIMVTSPYHQRRAGLEFRALSGDTITVLNHPATTDPDWPWYWWLTPRGWWLAGSEIIKIGAVHAGESR